MSIDSRHDNRIRKYTTIIVNYDASESDDEPQVQDRLRIRNCNNSIIHQDG